MCARARRLATAGGRRARARALEQRRPPPDRAPATTRAAATRQNTMTDGRARARTYESRSGEREKIARRTKLALLVAAASSCAHARAASRTMLVVIWRVYTAHTITFVCSPILKSSEQLKSVRLQSPRAAMKTFTASLTCERSLSIFFFFRLLKIFLFYWT